MEIYVIKGERGFGIICLNGVFVRLFYFGDILIIMFYVYMDIEEFKIVKLKVVLVDENNK